MQPFHASSSESSRTWLETTTCSTQHTLWRIPNRKCTNLWSDQSWSTHFRIKTCRKQSNNFWHKNTTWKHDKSASGHDNYDNLSYLGMLWKVFCNPRLEEVSILQAREVIGSLKNPMSSPCLFDLRHSLWSHTSCREQRAKCLVRHPNQPPGRSDLS